MDAPRRFPVSVVLPAFNEATAIGPIVAEMRSALSAAGIPDSEIIVVDDGSTDGTAAAAQGAGAAVVRHPVNGGYGRALFSGFAAARHDWVLLIDADGTYRADEAVGLLDKAEGCDMVVGARQGRLFWGSPGKAFLRWIQLRLSAFVAGIQIPDVNSGLRAVRREALKSHLPVHCYGFSLSTTMTLSFIQQGLFVRFVPVSYDPRKGSSKIRLLRDTLRTLQLMLEIIVYFNPLKFAVATAVVPAALAAAFAAYGVLRADSVALLTASVWAVGALVALLTGCALDLWRLQALANRSRCL